MLKALELYGFKSFADKTRFDFPEGITVVVGPNGSGKSNIVDAIKWVLGEHSAKGLRGKDMADVIFKGSGGAAGGGRKPLNSAEASLVLENHDRRFDFDADEILVTRRVYRSGEGEYLINGEPCRLKDIRQLFRGTGAGTDAYSLIEQGKVDRLLQASPKDRRAIFEEAAGISRFKAKKVETQRRLARVDQNLLRLSDIVEEVENRLRTVKAQATKAVRYKEFTERLQQLRTFVGMTDYRRLSQRLGLLEAEQGEFQATLVQCGDQVTQAEHSLAEADQWLSDVVALAAEDDEAMAQARQVIAEQQSRRQLHRSRGDEADQQIESTRRQLAQQKSRLTELDKLVAEQSQRLEDAEVAYHDAQQTVNHAEGEGARIAEEARESRQLIERLQAERSTADSERLTLRGRIDVHQQQLEQIQRSLIQLDQRVERWGLEEAQLDQERQGLERQRSELQAEMERRSSELSHAKSELQKATTRQSSLTDKANGLRSEYNGVCQRAAVIEELEQKLEGLNSGVKQLLREAQQHRDGPFRSVVGMVADLIQVNVQQANLVDSALGEMAQHLVVEDDQLIEMIAEGRLNLEGRVGLIRTGKFQGHGALREDLSNAEGVIGRADQMVQTAPGFSSLAQQLLGGTWIVKSMSDALRLRDEWARDVRYITLDGQIAELDGTLLVGPKSRGLGIVSRRSELRALRRDIQRLEEEQDLVQEQLIEVREKVQQQTADVDRFSSQQEELTKQLGDQQLMVQSVQQKLDRVRQDLSEGQAEQDQHRADQQRLEEQLLADTESFEEVEQAMATLMVSLDEAQAATIQFERQAQHWSQQLTQGKVALATCEQKLANEESRSADHRRDFEERQSAVEDLSSQLTRLSESLRSSQLGQLECTSQLALAYLEKERLQSKIHDRETIRTQRQTQRRDASRQLEEIRSKQRQLETELHQVELELGQLTLERSTLAERLRDDYGIEIADIEVELDDDAQRERAEIDQEIDGLRRRINSIGAVNLDALNELEELEGRFKNLEAQYNDLDTSKAMLEKIIDKINQDSRRLFAETLEAIRINFQSLYRRSFGGGKADLVVEQGVDILEAGIDIVATPPGKPEFNNSLLSGGERALTAVSLLMGIFQHRPSPFCVLDEVDAPFDEANIGRFIDVLKGFLGSTKFIIVTHSKKTMTAADTLYGVTMQESGVSKQVSVRFEDVSDDGEISPDAVEREQEDVA